jgi:hypothetical protein
MVVLENEIDENDNEAFEGGGDINELLELFDILINSVFWYFNIVVINMYNKIFS